MKVCSILLLLFGLLHASAQTSYSGCIDKYPIELVTYIFSDGDARAIYAYTNYDEPIVINGTLKQKQLVLYEKDSAGKNKATLTFINFDAKSMLLEGVWKDLRSDKQFKIILTKRFDIDYGENIEWANREIIQSESLKDQYFKLIISKEKGDFYAKVTGVKIMEKKTDKLIQQINFECQLWGLDNAVLEIITSTVSETFRYLSRVMQDLIHQAYISLIILKHANILIVVSVALRYLLIKIKKNLRTQPMLRRQ
ncbi:hypothetical protein KRR40_20205 [Niabella defluvii]|nr:hypothetical protein KRR40_20205 [Niabella sp. I65]